MEANYVKMYIIFENDFIRVHFLLLPDSNDADGVWPMLNFFLSSLNHDCGMKSG